MPELLQHSVVPFWLALRQAAICLPKLRQDDHQADATAQTKKKEGGTMRAIDKFLVKHPFGFAAIGAVIFLGVFAIIQM